MRKIGWKGYLAIGFGAFVALAAVSVPIYAHMKITNHIEPIIDEQFESVFRHKERVLADLRLLAKQSPLPEVIGNREAEPWMGQHLSWDVEGGRLDTPSHRILRDLLDKYPRWTADETQRRALESTPELMRLETDWLDRISEYDRWTPTQNRIVTSRLAAVPKLSSYGRIRLVAAMPTPDLRELKGWISLHVLKRHLQGRGSEGLKTFRKVAELSLTAGDLLAMQVAIGFFGLESRLAEILAIPHQEPVSPAALQALKRVSWAWVGVIRSSWFKTVPEEFREFMTPRTGMCAGVHENALGIAAYEDFLGPRFVFETDFSDRIRKSRQFMKPLYGICGIEPLSVLNETPPHDGVWTFAEALPVMNGGAQADLSSHGAAKEDDSNADATQWIKRIPYLRRLIGLTFHTIAQPDSLRMYDETGTAREDQ